jgi:hypothetical protein
MPATAGRCRISDDEAADQADGAERQQIQKRSRQHLFVAANSRLTTPPAVLVRVEHAASGRLNRQYGNGRVRMRQNPEPGAHTVGDFPIWTQVVPIWTQVVLVAGAALLGPLAAFLLAFLIATLLRMTGTADRPPAVVLVAAGCIGRLLRGMLPSAADPPPPELRKGRRAQVPSA